MTPAMSKLPLCLTTALIALGASASSAAAGGSPPSQVPLTTTDASVQSCRAPVIERPFLGFGDTRNYVLAPGGAFESTDGAGWIFARGASVAARGLSPAHALGGQAALSLPVGAGAVSPVMCVDRSYPTMRMLVRSVGDAPAELNVSVHYPDHRDAKIERVKSLTVKPGDGWVLVKDIPVKPEIMGKDSMLSRVVFVLDVVGKADQSGYQVDSLYVDPRMGR